MNISQLLSDAILGFDESQADWSIPVYPRKTGTEGFVRSSSLGRCPLKAAYEKHGVAPEIEDLQPKDDIMLTWLLRHGNVVAKDFQTAMLWLSTQRTNLAVSVEVPLVSDALKTTGRIDMIVQENHETAIVEIKAREGISYRSVPDPKLTDVLQVLSYGAARPSQHYYLLLISKWAFHVWEVKLEAEGYFRVYDEKGNLYQPTRRKEETDDEYDARNWNAAGKITMQAVIDEINRHAEYMKLVGDKIAEGEALTSMGIKPMASFPPPIQNPFEHPEGWQCCKVVDKGTLGSKNVPGRPATFEANCPWAKSCHGFTGYSLQMKRTKEGYVAIEES